MRVLLIAPHFGGWRDLPVVSEPLGISLLGAVLEQAGHEVRLLHQVTPEQLPDEAIVAAARRMQPDCVGVSAMSESYPAGLRLARLLKEACPAPIVFGGSHATFYPEIVREPSIDLAVLGHAVETLPAILDRLAQRRNDWRGIPGIAHKDNGGFVAGEPQPAPRELDALPFGKRDGLPTPLYKVMPMLMFPPSRQRAAGLYTAWGCKCNCKFCLVPKLYRHRWQAQSAGRVLAEIEHIRGREGINCVFFVDDDFCVDAARVEEICDGMRRRGWNLRFGMMTRPDNLTPRLVDAMEAAGLAIICLGVDVGTQEGMKELHKGLSLDEVRAAAAMLANRRIQVNVTSMVGFPWETRESILRSFAFVRTLPLDSWSVNTFIPFRGLEIRESMEREGLIEVDEPERRNYKDIVVRTRFLSREELESLVRYMLRRYYFSASYLARLARRMLRHPVMIRSAFEVLIWGLTRRSRLLFQSGSSRRRSSPSF